MGTVLIGWLVSMLSSTWTSTWFMQAGHNPRPRLFENEGLNNFSIILTTPDNVAILIFLAITIFVQIVGLRQCLIHDRHLKEGRRDKVYEEMCK